MTVEKCPLKGKPATITIVKKTAGCRSAQCTVVKGSLFRTKQICCGMPCLSQISAGSQREVNWIVQ